MAQLTIVDAAAHLGVSADTVRRKVKRGDLPHTKDAHGRYFVTIDDDRAAEERPATAYATPMHSPTQEDDRAYAEADASAQQIAAILTEVSRQRDTLETQVTALLAQAERADTERAELRRLLGNAQMQLAALLPEGRARAEQAQASRDHSYGTTPAVDEDGHMETTTGQDRPGASRGAPVPVDAPPVPTDRAAAQSQRRSWWYRLIHGDHDPAGMPGVRA